MNNKQHIFTILLLISSLCMSGCLQYEERIVLNKDSSGTMEVEYWTLGDTDIEVDDHKFPHMGEDVRREVEEKYTSEKVRLVDFDVREEKDSRNVRFTLSFDHILDLNDIEQFHKNKIRFTRSKGKLSFSRDVFLNGDSPGEKKEPGNVFEKMVLGLVEKGLSQIRFRFEVEMPETIDKSNADFTSDSNRAIWKFSLSDVMYEDKVRMELETD